MNLVTIIGARPQFVKAAVVSKELNKCGFIETIVHTGQHYDDKMSKVFWDELNIPGIAVNLGVGSGTQGSQTGGIIEKFEAFLLQLNFKPQGILLYGDTNSTLAGALVGAKMQIPVVHVESGLRSFNRGMPEEINRIVTDHLSSILFCSSSNGVQQLEKEGITNNVFDVGDVMFDGCMMFGEIAGRSVDLQAFLPFEKKEKYSVLTLHRPSNTDDGEILRGMLSALGGLDTKILWPVHPRLRSKIETLKIPANIYPVDPLSYFEMLVALKNAHKIFTDSGGLQKEAYWMKKNCITLRNETEWTETLHHGWNILAGVTPERIQKAYMVSTDHSTWVPLYTHGNASELIANTMKKILAVQ